MLICEIVAKMQIPAKFIIKGANISSNTLITEENLSTKNCLKFTKKRLSWKKCGNSLLLATYIDI